MEMELFSACILKKMNCKITMTTYSLILKKTKNLLYISFTIKLTLFFLLPKQFYEVFWM